MILTILLPDGTNATVDIAVDTLVYDGSGFVQPADAQYVALYSLPVDAVTLPYKDIDALPISAAVTIRAFVISRDPTIVDPTSPDVIVAPDPSFGTCICGITCQGTEIRYIVVQPED